MEMNNAFKVDFIGIGAPKCGTTWLAQCLSEHPEIYIPKQKEINYFQDTDVGNYKRGLNWYEEQFKNITGEKVLGEYTTHYMYHENAYNLIKKDMPDVKLIVTLRNPVEMVYSLYKWKKANYESLNVPDNFEDAYNSSTEYKEKGQYYKYLKPYFDLFYKKDIKVILHDDIKESSENVYKDVCDFLGVSNTYIPESLNTSVNAAKKPRSKIISGGVSFGISLMNKIGLKQLVHDVVNSTMLSNLYAKVNKVDAKYEPMKYETKKMLIDTFKDDVQKLEKLIDRDLSRWVSV